MNRVFNSIFFFIIAVIIIRYDVEALDTRQPIVVCQRNKKGILYRLITPDICHYHDNSTLVKSATIYKDNLELYKTVAYSYEWYELTCKTKYSFFFTKQEQESEYRKKCTAVECYKKMVKNSCYLGEEGFEDNVQLSYTRDVQCKHSWMSTKYNKGYKCVKRKGYVTKGHYSKAISSLGDVEHCDYNNGFCMTVDNIYITWEVNKNEEKDFIKVREVNNIHVIGFKRGNAKAILVDQDYLLVKNCSGIKLFCCDTTAGLRICFSIRHIRSFKKYFLREDLEETPNNDQLFEMFKNLREEMEAKVNFIVYELQGPIQSINQLCDLNKYMLKLAVSQTKQSASNFIRARSGRNDFDAISDGKYILVWPCINVSDWNIRKTTKCSGSNIPIKLRIDPLGNYQNASINPVSGDVDLNPIERDCRGSEKYIVETSEGVYVVNSQGEYVRHFKEDIKDFSFIRNSVHFELDFFNNSWFYNQSDFKLPDGADANKKWTESHEGDGGSGCGGGGCYSNSGDNDDIHVPGSTWMSLGMISPTWLLYGLLFWEIFKCCRARRVNRDDNLELNI